LLQFIIRRLIGLVVIVFIVVVLNFMLMHLAPGDPISILAGVDHPSQTMVNQLRAKYGLDQPLSVQFKRYVGNLLHGDLGRSIIYDQPVSKLIGQRLPPTLLLTLTAAVVSLVLGILLGTWSATELGSRFEGVISTVSYTFYAMPAFWLGLMLMLVFSSILDILPTSGMTSSRHSYVGLMHWLDVAKHLVLPVTTLILIETPVYYRITRTSILQSINSNFVTMLTASGMKESTIFNKYVLKNAILPTVTMFGLRLGYVITGAALVEIVFAWPGMGRLTLDAVFRRDYTLLMGVYLAVSISVGLMILITDVVYAYIDPRIRYE